MAIDPSIPLGVQPFQAPDPLATAARVGQLRNQQQASRMNELQIQSAEAQHAAAQRAAQEEAALSQLFSGDRIPSPGEINRIVGPERGMAIYKGLMALQQEKQKAYGSTQELLRDVLLGMNALPEGLRATAYGPVRQNLLSRQVITEQDAPEAYDPAWWQQTASFGKEPAKAEPFTLSPGQQRFGPDGQPIANVPPAPPPTPAPFNLSPGQTRFGPDGKPIASLPPTPTRAPEPSRSWVLRNGLPVRVTESEIQPGDAPYSPPRSTGDTAQDRQRTARTQAARGFLNKLNELREKINTKMGPAAGITGTVRRGRAAIGLDPDVAEYERERAAGGRSLAVAIMGAQNLSDADAKAWADMLPGATVDAETAKRLMAQVETMLNDMNPDGEAPAAPSAPPKKNPFR